MLGVGRMVRARDWNCDLYVEGVYRNYVVCQRVYERAYPRVMSTSDEAEQKRLRKEGYAMVNAVEKLAPRSDGTLVPLVVEQYRTGIDTEEYSERFIIELELNCYGKANKTFNSERKMTTLEFIKLQCLLQKLDIRQIRQMASTYGFVVDGLIRTHIGGYLYPNGTIEDWIRNTGQREAARTNQVSPVHQQQELNVRTKLG